MALVQASKRIQKNKIADVGVNRFRIRVERYYLRGHDVAKAREKKAGQSLIVMEREGPDHPRTNGELFVLLCGIFQGEGEVQGSGGGWGA